MGVSTNAFGYGPAGDLLTLADGDNHATVWKYDVYGRVTNKLDNAGSNLFFYGYDPDNRLTNRFSAAKGTTVYNYDAVGNLTNVTYPVSASLTFTYDVLNRLTKMLDATGTNGYAYDAAGQLLSEDGPWSDDTVSYTYNNRLRTGMSVQSPNASAWAITYGYDAGRRLTNVTSPAGAFGYSYQASSASSLPVYIWLPNGGYNYHIYDSLARVTYVAFYALGAPSSPVDSHQYTYDLAGQRTQEQFGLGNTLTYTYDGRGQLQTARGQEDAFFGGINRSQEQFGYTYDAAGNLLFRTNNALVQAFGVNSLNELTNRTRTGTLTVAGSLSEPGGYTGTTPGYATNVTVSGTGLTSGSADLYQDGSWARTNATLANGNNTYTAAAYDTYGRSDTNSVTVYLPATNTFTYDLNGNLLSDGTRNFAYDDENQLVSVWQTNGWRSDFVYDGKMLSRRNRVGNGPAGTVPGCKPNEFRYVYDGNLVIQGTRHQQFALGDVHRGNDLSHTLQGAGGIGGLLARTDNSLFLAPNSSLQASAFYNSEGNGNITCLINASNTLVASYQYDPYGNIISQSGSLADANLYRFSSKEAHPNSGLIYYRYRYFEPNLQRWVNRDPLQDNGFRNLTRNYRRQEAADMCNVYMFVWNQPITMRDPFGLYPSLDPYPWNNPMREIEELIEHAMQTAKDAGKCAGLVRLVACASCGAGTLGIEAICAGWKSQGYGSFNDCLCTEMSQNTVAKAACASCFAPASFFGNIWGSAIGCGGGSETK